MSRIITDDEFTQQFRDFEHTAWKLEVRDRYNVSKEARDVRRFLSTGDLGRDADFARTSRWHRNVASRSAEGKTWQRVRVVSEPLSDYIRWEHAVTRFNVEAGEDIRWLPRHNPAVQELPDFDFWLFDGAWGCLLHFDDDDVPFKSEHVDDPATIALYRKWRDIAWQQAIPHGEYDPESSKRFNI
ncbi:hypothetical protein SAMN05421803_11550 [Nocardiopsis flavescens]|uniref:DUF6879 domain-containing protein n=1 Tax=Nocardiopsis flavescens TaxID=758803 RepID=A0A1M6QGW4_9ACTN|nr:DUF6879 family protein [Nocardiopsis flavescens]SHK19313.1 hypothetical protein SAMN05421803_11550 [Nocardiopsis flavescens]